MLKVEFVTNSVFSSRTYILSDDGSDEVWLVDCGDVDKVLEHLGDRSVQGVLLTHAHFDHLYGLPSLLELFPNVAIYTNEWGKKALSDDKLNMSRYHECPIRIDCPNVQVLKDGDKVCGFDVLETPGHNPSSICYANDMMIFTGDAWIPGCKVVTSLPNCDKVLAEASHARILALSSGKTIYPGHTI